MNKSYEPNYINYNIVGYSNTRKFFMIEIKVKSEDKKKIEHFDQIYNEKLFKKNIIPIIFNNAEKLHYSQNENNEENKNIKPKYFENEQIKEEIKKLEHLFERKKIVEERLKKEKKYILKEDQFIFYISLLIRDNTNVNLLKKYLIFLYYNENHLNKLKIENFNDEINRYQCCFEPNDQLFKEVNFKKEKSEFKQFVDLLFDIKNKDLLGIKKEMIDKKKEIKFFNQPIRIYNKELFNYRNKYLLIYAFEKVELEDFKEKKIIVSAILEQKILERDDIINDFIKFTFLIIIILYGNKDNFQFFLNMLTAKKNNKQLDLKNSENLCIENLESKNYKINELYNFDYLVSHPPLGINITLIKKFLSSILGYNTFKDIYQVFYENSDFIEIDELIDFLVKTIYFVPFKSNSTWAITDKFTNTSFIFIMDKEIINLPNQQIDLISEILKTAIIIEIIFHEINHKIYSLYFCFSNNSIPFETPRKKEMLDKGESEYYIEILLFGRVIENLNLVEALYLLNENNYKKI